ncbi:hypothetical protein [Microseira wollei]|uniref:Uncharacterized protein n=1 Tax=Microseira wollei NIES-4236 TaxID=2530354 RepID=A0AAV3X848_9CYAN|nr:hypothetical protein [Microseira wollei]GET37528.1 hypothetical protein MiSe_22810 [Microseira wollei NIES-4236]
MTALFNRIQPAAKFRITKGQIAKFLGIAESAIKDIQRWHYVLFVHRRDRGGQFISYRKLEQWKNALASHMQKCETLQQLNFLKSAISRDSKKYGKQYNDAVKLFLHQIWQKCQEKLLREREAILSGGKWESSC